MFHGLSEFVKSIFVCVQLGLRPTEEIYEDDFVFGYLNKEMNIISISISSRKK